MRSKEDYEAFEKGVTALSDRSADIDDDKLCGMLVDYLDSQLEQFQCPGVNRDYASQYFRRHLQRKGRSSIAEQVMEWAEECANGIRWPVAFVYIATGKLPGDYHENTTVAVVVEDRDGKVVGHRVINWRNFSHIEDDTECYTALNEAIDDCAVELGARSIFTFHCDGRLTKSASVAYHPEQGPSVFDQRSYDKRPER